MRAKELIEDGRIVKGVNTTVDVDTDEIPRQAEKFGNKVDKDGRPPTLSKKVKGKSTNVLFNLGLSEASYEGNIGIMELMHFFAKATKDAPELVAKVKELVKQKRDKEVWKIVQDYTGTKLQGKEFEVDEKWSKKYKRSINCNNPKGFSQKAHCQGRKKNEEVTINDLDAPTPTIQMLARKWNVTGKEVLTQVEKGVKVEAEHTTDFEIALEIALDHINEDLHYYDKLAKVEEAGSLGELSMTSEIYVDMDGVLADFFGEWARLMGVDHFTDINKKHDINDALQKIRDTDDFWLRLPMLPEAKNLLSLIKQIKGNYNICSSPLADDPNSEKHKRTWVAKNLKAFPPENVYITHDKAHYATQPDGTPNILIDDYGVNIRKWEAAGGIGFKYKDHKFERTAKAIKQHMQEPVEENFDNISDIDLNNALDTMAKNAVNGERLKDVFIMRYQHNMTFKQIGDEIGTGLDRARQVYQRALRKIRFILKDYVKENFADGKKNEGAEITMWTNPEYQGADVDDKYYKKQPVKVLDVSKLTPFEPADKMDPKDNHDNMMKFVDKIKAGEKIKPIVVVPHEGKLLIVDGHHRYFAHLKAGIDKIRAVIADTKDLTWRDDVPESVKESSNCPRTKASKCQCESVNKITEAEETITAVCVLEHSDTVKGTILFKQKANGPTLIVGKITGLKPGEHGFHIHEFGDLSNGCESAGGHYNPDGVDHGDLEEGHVGDLGNVIADDNGTADIKIVAKRVDLVGERSVVGRAIVIHSDVDDLGQGGDDESLKTGNAGDRLACGVIVLRNEKLEENFADGKKKGKSRPGRVKRAGASCNGSVTALRKRAKNASGEKARMYHWCANMKSGRKKS